MKEVQAEKLKNTSTNMVLYGMTSEIQLINN
jgi:hypothetical protein